MNDSIRTRSRLRTRMAVSYVGVTLVIVLLLESVVVGVMLYILTRSPVIAYWATQNAGNSAQILALQAAVRADEAGLDPRTTFVPGQPASLSLEEPGEPHEENWFRWSVPYVEPGATTPDWPVVALVIGPDEQVLASSYPDRYPAATNLAQALPEDAALVRAALAGRPGETVRETAQGTFAAVTRPIWSRDRRPIGAIYLQAPAGGPPDTNLLPELLTILIPSGLAWLCLTLPIGLVFGVLTTRGLIKRIERLAGATTRFKDGELTARVPVGRADEIGQLERQFNQMAEQLVESIAQRQSLAAESARREERARIEQEMLTAHYIQQSLLPEAAPAVQGWEIQAVYRPARQVGGDLYDFLALPDGRIGIVIGDATGKGIPSALIMATTCAMLRAAAPGAESPGQVLGLVNNLLQNRIPRHTFATCFFAILEPASGRLRYANAGHNLPYLARHSQVLELDARGMPLGLMPEQEYSEREITIAPQDCVLFYTDGLVEAHDEQRSMFGSQRLKQRLQAHGRDGLIERLFQDLQDFTGPDCEQEDDVTLVVLKKIT